MRIKIQCPCGTRYAFDVEPLNGRMPGPVQCPSCGTEGTAHADAIMQQELAQATDARPRVRIGAAPSSAVTPAHAVPADTNASSASAAAAADYCARHTHDPAAAHCFVCHKPICLNCMEQFGYLCSVYCQNQAAQRKLQVPVYEHQKGLVRQKERHKEKRVILAAGLAVLVLGLLYGVYAFVGSRPKLLFSIKIAKAERPAIAQLIAPDEMLLLKGNKLSLYRLDKGKEKWSTPLPASKPAANAGRNPSLLFEDEPSGAQVHVRGEDIWVSLADRMVRVDRPTGKIKSEVPVPDTVRQVTVTDSSILVISENAAKRKQLTHITLPAGTAQTQEVEEERAGATPAGRQPAKRGPLPPAAGDRMETADWLDLDSPGAKEFVSAGVNVMQIKSRLLETRRVAYQAMKAPQVSTLNNPGLTARDSMKAAGELLNEMQREGTGGVAYENESRYQVTLRRFLPANAPDWIGEVNGPPLVFPQKTVDVLAAGKTLTVFNKKNAKLWEARLTFPVSEKVVSSYSSDETLAPCLEDSGALFFFDKGMLTAFDLRSGEARWRVPSVGISRVARDGQGPLYVATTSASPDSIQYSQQIKLGEKDYPVVLRIDPRSGKVLWRAERIGDQCFTSGKFVYATRVQTSGLDMMKAAMNGGDVPVHFRLHRVNPGNGAVLWEYYQPRAPRRVDVQKNRILLQFADEVQVVTFLAL